MELDYSIFVGKTKRMLETMKKEYNIVMQRYSEKEIIKANKLDEKITANNIQALITTYRSMGDFENANKFTVNKLKQAVESRKIEEGDTKPQESVTAEVVNQEQQNENEQENKSNVNE